VRFEDTIPELRADGFLVRFLVVGGGGGGGRLPRALGLQAHTLQAYTVQYTSEQLSSEMEFLNGIFSQGFFWV
jgi:hypothetical protein